MKLLAQVGLTSLIIVKIALGSIFIYMVEPVPLFLERDALASEPQKYPEKIVEPARPVSHREPSGPARRTAGGEAADEDETIVEEEIDLNFLLNKKAELEKEEEEIAKKKAELVAIKKEINNKIVILTQLRNEIKAQMATIKTVKEKKLKHLIKAYSAMKPQKAATLIEKLDITFAIELLSNMKGDAVGNILSFVDTEKAAKISKGLAHQQ